LGLHRNVSFVPFSDIAPCTHPRIRDKDRQVAELMFDRFQRRESEFDDVLKQERARHDAAMKNLQRLRTLQIEREAKNHKAEKRA
jgi:hypothetical protein